MKMQKSCCPPVAILAFLGAILASVGPSYSQKSFTLVFDTYNEEILCAMDRPTTTIYVDKSSVDTQDLENNICANFCNRQKSCISFNLRLPESAPARCELFSTVPRNCTALNANGMMCIHYEIDDGTKRSCRSPATVTTEQATTSATPSSPLPPTTSEIMTSQTPATMLPPATSGFKTTLLQTTARILTTMPPTTPSATCPPEWLEYNFNCYLFVVKPSTQPTAEKFCVSKEAHLTSINDEKERTYIGNRTSTDVWIGLVKQSAKDNNPNNVYWLDGSRVTTLFWKTDNPNNVHTVCVNMNSNNKFNDKTCDSLFRFVCKKPISGQMEEKPITTD